MKYIITHKDFDLPIKKDEYTVICPKGVKIKNWTNVEHFDNGLDNRMWNEIAGMKYIADTSNEEWIQINHYRRIIDAIPTKCCIAEAKYLNKINIAQQYALCHNEKDLAICSGIVKELYPEYYNIWLQTLQSNIFIPYNIVQMPRDCYKDYMEKMCKILQKFMEICGINNYADMVNHIKADPTYTDKNGIRNIDVNYQARLVSFLSERITTWYINCLAYSNAVIYPCRISKYENAY